MDGLPTSKGSTQGYHHISVATHMLLFVTMIFGCLGKTCFLYHGPNEENHFNGTGHVLTSE